MTLVARRKLAQTWRGAVEDRARTGAPDRAGDCMASFDAALAAGMAEAEAAHAALAAFGLLWDVDAPDLSASAPRGGPDETPAQP